MSFAGAPEPGLGPVLESLDEPSVQPERVPAPVPSRGLGLDLSSSFGLNQRLGVGICFGFCLGLRPGLTFGLA